MQKPCQDSYYTLFSSYPMLLDYHEEQAKNSRWIRCKVADLQVEPLGESSPLIGNLSAFAAGTSQEAVKDTAENLGLAMRVNGELYPVRMTAYKSLLDRAKIGGTALSKLSREVLAEVLNECLKLYSADALLLIRDEKISAVHSGDEVDYSILPIDELLKALQAKLDARFSGNEFESGYCDHSLVSASWRMPDQKEDLLGTYAKVLAAQGKATMASKLMPGIRFMTSDTGVASAKVSALLMNGRHSMRDGILSKEDYLDIKEQYEMRISEAQLAEEQIRHEINLYIENGNAPQRWIQEFLDHRNIQSLTRIVAVECIDHIMIYEGKRIEVTFAHMQDYEALVSRVKDYYINQREVG